MLGLSPVHILILLVLVLLLFGGNRISNMMGDVAKGIKSFKKGMAEDDDDVPPTKPAQKIESQPVPPQPTASEQTSDTKQD